MGSIKKIKELLKLTKKKTYKINMYAEAILDDARVIATDSESFDIGSEVYVINDSGEVESIAEGIYTLEDGTKIRIDAESKVAGFGEEEVVEEEVVVEEELAVDDGKEADVDDWAGMEKRILNLEDAIADIKKRIGEGDDVEMSEEKTELSADVMGEVITRLNSIEEKFSSFEDSASSEGVNITPSSNEVDPISLKSKARLSGHERARELINSFK